MNGHDSANNSSSSALTTSAKMPNNATTNNNNPQQYAPQSHTHHYGQHRAAGSNVRVDSGTNSGSGNSSGSDFVSDEEYAWIPWYTSLKGNEFFCEVDDEYAQDSFNLTGLASLVPNFEPALDLILDVETSSNDMMTDDQQEQIENDAETLFGLVHARYILTSRGLAAMYDKYKAADFGRCPRVLCDGQAMLPVGLADQPAQHAVKLYCPRCEDVYHPSNPRHQHIDGAFFGSTFPHLFLLTYPELKAEAILPVRQTYVPRIFGFRIHKSAYQRALQDKQKSAASGHNNATTPQPAAEPHQQQAQLQLGSANPQITPSTNTSSRKKKQQND